MAEEKNPVGVRINLAKLSKEIEKNNHKIKVNEFMDCLYLVMMELEENHPLFKELKETPNYDQMISTIIFSLCIRLSQITLGVQAMEKMIERLTEEKVELPPEKKDLN